MLYKLGGVIVLCFLLYGCKESVSYTDYNNWVLNPSNGLYKTTEQQGLNVEVLNKPIPYIIGKEFKSQKLSASDYNKRTSELREMQYFDLKISPTNGQPMTSYLASDQNEQQANLYYLSYEMQKDIKLIEGQDTLPCLLYHYERYYQLDKQTVITLAFPQKKGNSNFNKKLSIHPRIWAENSIEIEFQHKDLKNIPALKIES